MGKEYRDVVNRPNVADRIGGTLSGVAKSNPAITQQQRNGNAFLAGAGAGAQGVGDGIRSAKLEKYEGYAKELAMMDAQLKIQMGKNEMTKQTYTQFASNYFHDIKRTDKAYGDGDYDAMNRLLPNMLAGLKKINPDMAAQLGSFSHTYDNNAYFTTPDGKSQGVNIKDLFAQTLGSMDEERQQEFPNLLSSVSSDKFAAARAADRAKIEKDEAHTRNMDAQTELYGAQAEKSYTEAGKIGQEMNNKPSPEKLKIQETINLQKDAIKDIYKSRVNDSFYKSAMKIAEGTLQSAEKDPSEYERNIGNRLADRDGKYIRMNKEQEALHAVGAEIKGAMFKRFKYRNQTEFENLPDISPNKTVEQNIEILKIIQNTYDRMVEEENNSINSFNELQDSLYEDQGESSDQPTTPELMRDENGTVYRIEG